MTRDAFLGRLPRSQKTATVLLKCVVVDSDGFPVDGEGEPISGRQRAWFDWDKRARPVKWLRNRTNRKWWRVPKLARRRAA